MMPTGHRVCLAHNISRGQERRVVSAQGLRGTRRLEGAVTAPGALTGPTLGMSEAGRVSPFVLYGMEPGWASERPSLGFWDPTFSST